MPQLLIAITTRHLIYVTVASGKTDENTACPSNDYRAMNEICMPSTRTFFSFSPPVSITSNNIQRIVYSHDVCDHIPNSKFRKVPIKYQTYTVYEIRHLLYRICLPILSINEF